MFVPSPSGHRGAFLFLRSGQKNALERTFTFLISLTPQEALMTTASAAHGTPEVPQPDRREVRIHCRLTVEFRYGSLNDYGTCWNLGLHGMYIAHEGEFDQGEPIDISFFISDEYPSLIEASAKVVWVNSGSSYKVSQFPEGFGIEFITISEGSMAAIHKFIFVG